MARFTVDWLDVVMDLLRGDMPGVKVMSRIPDQLIDHLPLVVVRRVAGDSPAPEFYDEPWVNVQCWAADPGTPDSDAYRAASDLADQVRGVLWRAYRTQRVITGRGWLVNMRESTAPQEISDPDVPFLGRYSATYELRVRPVT